MKSISSILVSFTGLFFIPVCILSGCKKNNDGVSYETSIRFTYNGKQYEGGSGSKINSSFYLPQFIFANFAGLQISRPDLFGGEIEILDQNQGNIDCAYLSPSGAPVAAVGLSCNNLQQNNGPIDSVQVYWIESGTIGFGYSDCRARTGTVTPNQYDCAVHGNFELILTNKNGQKIVLSNGSFTGRINKW